jgi:hypothetical protein
MENGLLDSELYYAGTNHFNSLRPETVRGYHIWAVPVVQLMKRYPRLNKLLAPIARARYEFIVNKKFSLIGASTVYIAQPVCFVIGLFVSPAVQQVGELNGGSVNN